MGFFLLLIFAVLLISAPILIGAFLPHIHLSALSSILMTGTGIILALVCSILLTIAKLYNRTKASEAFVRTGMGGLKVIRDGGALVLPAERTLRKEWVEVIHGEDVACQITSSSLQINYLPRQGLSFGRM